MNWFSFSLLSITALAFAELTQQYILKTKNHFDERTSGVLTFFIQSIFAFPLIFLFGSGNELFSVFKPEVFGYMILANVLGATAMIFYLRSFKVKSISISTIFVSFSVVVSTILGIIIFNESFYFYKLLGIVLIFIALLLLNIKNLQIEKNHYFGLLAGLFFGIIYTIDKFVVLQSHPIVYIFWALLFVSIFGFLFNPRQVLNSLKGAKREHFKPIIYSGCGYFLFNFFTLHAYTLGGEVGRVDAINNSQVFLIIMAEYFIFKQKDGAVRKVIAAVTAFIGVLILGYL